VKDEEATLKRLLPWLSSEFGEELQWLGSPEDRPGYSSDKCLDGEVAGPHIHLAIEHTALGSYLNQWKTGAVFRELGSQIQARKGRVPRGQSVCVVISETLAHRGASTKQVKKATPELLSRLDAYLQTLAANPPRLETSFDRRLEKQTWSFAEFEFVISRRWSPGASHIRLIELHNPSAAPAQLDQCMVKSLKDKVSGKGPAWEKYRRAGWRTLLVLQLADPHLLTFETVADSFRRLCPTINMVLLDDVVLMQQILDDPVECCWAYKGGEIRTPDQQASELTRCLELP
jgi:hypothetical protein